MHMTFEELPAEYRELIERRLSGRAYRKPDPQPGEAIWATADRTQTSLTQQRVWVMQALAANPASSNVPAMWRVTGDLIDIRVLTRALADVSRRHEILRTRYLEVNGELKQDVWTHDVALPGYVDLTHMSLPAALAEARKCAEKDTLRPFDLTRDAPVRLTVYRLRPDDHVLHACFHHIAVDGPSMELFWREISITYDALSCGGPMPEPSPVQYVDFAAWQNAWVDSAEAALHLAFWRNFLADAPQQIDMAIDHDRPRVPRGEVESMDIDIAYATATRLRALARAEGATPFMTLLAALYAFLFSRTGQTDIVIGSPIAGRPRPELDNVIGLFVNSLALRLRWTGDPTFLEILDMTRSMTLSAYQHQDLPFQRVVQALRPPRRRNRSPFFNIWFDVSLERPQLRFGSARVTELPIGYTDSEMDMEILIEESAEGLSCSAIYSKELYEAATVRLLLSRFSRLLQVVAEVPDQPLTSIIARAGSRLP
jgi:hypothetical protein